MQITHYLYISYNKAHMTVYVSPRDTTEWWLKLPISFWYGMIKSSPTHVSIVQIPLELMVSLVLVFALASCYADGIFLQMQLVI